MPGSFAVVPASMARVKSAKTRYPGIRRVDATTFLVRAKVTTPSGQIRQAERVLDDTTLEEAVKSRALLLAELRQEPTAGLPPRPTVAQWASFWLDSKRAQGIEPGSWRNYRNVVQRHILPSFLARVEVASLRAADVQGWLNRQEGTAQTRRTRLSVLVNMIRDAVAQLHLTVDPTMRLTWPEYEDRPEDNYLKPEQFWTWLRTFQEIAQTHYAYALTLALTGMRPCHVRALRWEDVDFEAKALRPRVKVYEGEVRPISRKKRAPREFPLPDILAETLRAHHAWLHSPMRHYHRGLVLQHPGAASGYCFPSANGTPQAQSQVWRAWQKTCERVGVQVNPRGLRRTFNNLLRLASVDSITAGELTAQTGAVRRLYSTVELNEKRDAVAKVLKLVEG